MSNTLKLTLGYTGTDFERTLNLAYDEASLGSTFKAKIKAINESLAGGTSGGLDNFFVSDDFDGEDGKLKEIKAAKVVSVTEQVIYPESEG